MRRSPARSHAPRGRRGHRRRRGRTGRRRRASAGRAAPRRPRSSSLNFCLGALVAGVAVGMAVLGEPSECRLDVLLARPPGKPQYVVVVALGHKLVFRSSLLRRGLSLAAASIKAKPPADHNLNDMPGCWSGRGLAFSLSPQRGDVRPTSSCRPSLPRSRRRRHCREAPFFFCAPPASAPGPASPPPACCAP